MGKLSILQVMKLVAFAGVGLAFAVPGLRMWCEGGAHEVGSIRAMTTYFGAILLLAAWAGLALVVVRRGPRRDALIFALLLGAVLMLLAGVAMSVVVFATRDHLGGQGGRSFMAGMSAFFLVLAALAWFLGRGLAWAWKRAAESARDLGDWRMA